MIRTRGKANRRLVGGGEGVWNSRGLLRMLALLIVLLSGCGGYWYGRNAPPVDSMKLVVWADQFFRITSVEISDVQKVSRQEVLAALDLAPASGLLSTDTAKLKRSLESHPWIQQADVRRVFPDTLVVELKEREPAAVLRAGMRELLLGDDGGVIAEATQGTFEGFPILTGIDYTEAIVGSAEITERVLAGIALASVLGEVGVNRMEVDLRTPGDMVAYYDGLRIRFGQGAFEDKVERYRRLAERGFKRVGEIQRQDLGDGAEEQSAPSFDGRGRALSGGSKQSEVEVDLRFQDRVIVRDKGGKRVWAEKIKSS